LTSRNPLPTKVVFLLLALPIPIGISDTTKGTVNESSIDILDTTANDAFWANCILTYDQACSDELIRCSVDGWQGRKPPHLTLPPWWADLGFPIPLQHLRDNEEDKAKPTINTLTFLLTKITNFFTYIVTAP
jgi:hypothetical protein